MYLSHGIFHPAAVSFFLQMSFWERSQAPKTRSFRKKWCPSIVARVDVNADLIAAAVWWRERGTGRSKTCSERGTRRSEPCFERGTGRSELCFERGTGRSEPCLGALVAHPLAEPATSKLFAWWGPSYGIIVSSYSIFTTECGRLARSGTRTPLETPAKQIFLWRCVSETKKQQLNTFEKKE